MFYFACFNFFLLIAFFLAFRTTKRKKNPLLTKSPQRKDKHLSHILYNTSRIPVIVAVLLITFTALKDGSRFYDNEEYVDSIMYGSERFEFTWNIICKFARIIRQPFLGVFFVYAIIGIGFKSYAINKLVKYPWIAFCVYLSHFYVLQDCVQIRVGAATGFIMLSILFWVRKDFIKWTLCAVGASIMQYSCAMVLLLPFICKMPLKLKYWKWFIFGSYILSILSVNISAIFNALSLDIFSSYYSHYLLNENTVSIFNVSQVLYCILALFLLKNEEFFSKRNKAFDCLIRLFVISISIYPLFATIPVLATRGSQIFGVVDMLLISILFEYKLPKYFKYLFFLYLFYSLNSQILRSIVL